MPEQEKRIPSAVGSVPPEAGVAGEADTAAGSWEGYSLAVLDVVLDP